jgi:serine/threonine protein kinase
MESTVRTDMDNFRTSIRKTLRDVPHDTRDTRSSEVKRLHDVGILREDRSSGMLDSEEIWLVQSELNRMTRKIVSSPSQMDADIPDLHYTSVQSPKPADKLRELEDKILEMQKCITELRMELYSERLKAKENIQAKTKVISDLQTELGAQSQHAVGAAAILCDTGKETQGQALEHDIKAMRYICHSPHEKMRKLRANEMDVYPELLTCDNKRETHGLRKCDEIEVEVRRQLGLSEKYLSSEVSQNVELTLAQGELCRTNCEEIPGLKLELHALRSFVDKLKEAERKNGVLRRLVKELQRVEADHEDEMKQLLIRTDSIILSAANKVNKHQCYCEMIETLQKSEEISNQIRVMLQSAVDLWEYKFRQKKDYSRFRTLGQMQKKGTKEELLPSPGPQTPLTQEERAPGGRKNLSLSVLDRIDVSDFDILRFLGNGEFGTVFLVSKKGGIDDGQLYAMKVIEKARIIQDKKTIQHTITERLVLQAVRQCPFLVTLHYAFQTDSKLYLILDYMSRDLFTHLSYQRKLSEDEVKFYVGEIILALEYLHKLDIIHRDIKLENILLDFQGHVVLTDFGLSKIFLTHETRRAYSCCGTYKYMAPEVIQAEGGYDMTADWWSVGVLTYELLTGVSPFSHDRASDTEDKVFYRILKTNPIIPDSLSQDASDFISKLLVKDPEGRLGGGKDNTDEIKRHSFFKGMSWSDLVQRKIMAPFTPSLENELDVSAEEISDDTPAVAPPECNELFRGYSYMSPSFIWSENAASDEFFLPTADTVAQGCTSCMFQAKLPETDMDDRNHRHEWRRYD